MTLGIAHKSGPVYKYFWDQLVYHIWHTNVSIHCACINPPSVLLFLKATVTLKLNVYIRIRSQVFTLTLGLLGCWTLISLLLPDLPFVIVPVAAAIGCY